jgi:hypothetical protein
MDSVENDVVLSVLLGENQQWHVTTQNFSGPLASFDDPRSACEWAIQRAKPTRGKVLVEEIPVAWDTKSGSRLNCAR